MTTGPHEQHNQHVHTAITAASVELRIENRQVVCDWGAFGDAAELKWDWTTDSVTAHNVAPLILVSTTYADDETCPSRRDLTSTCVTFYAEDGRRFMRIGAANGTWTWELFNAHWDDGEECNVYVGSWRE
ncbi:hypothetical protein ACPCIR_12770 [Mycobacterium sp. NPDC051198]